MDTCVVCMYVSFGQGSSLLWTHTLRPFYSRPIALTQEGRSLVNDVCKCVREWRVRTEEGWVGMSSLSGIYSAPLLGVAYCLAWAQLTEACYSTSVNGPSQVYHFSGRQHNWHLDAANKVPAMVTFYRGHRRTLCCLPGIISLIIMFVGIIFT